jgi:hypothetical protein
MLQEGDIVELEEGMAVYTDVPEHFVYTNRRGVFDKIAHSLVTIEGHLGHLAGRYVVYKTSMDGGGHGGHHPADVYPDGHHVFAEKTDDPSIKIDFYQTGHFTAMLPKLQPVAKAVRKWAKAEAFLTEEERSVLEVCATHWQTAPAAKIIRALIERLG